MNDYFRLRVELNLAQFSDDVVEETGHDVERAILLRQPVTARDIAWLIEAAARAHPKEVH